MKPEILAAIEELGQLQFSTSEVAIIIEQDEKIFEEKPEAFRAYMKGRLIAQRDVRRALLELARQGSTPAQKEFMKLAAESEPEYEQGGDHADPA
jgi:hypothetical protein